MPLFMFQGAYSSDSWATQVQDQPDPVARIGRLAEACGGRLESLFYSFGEYDIVLILDMPDDEAAAAFALAGSAGGSLKAARTTKLFTVEQGLSAMRKAAEAGKTYTPPVSTPAAPTG